MQEFQINGFQVYSFLPESSSALDETSSTVTPKAMFFAHANGIGAYTYKTLLQGIANALTMEVISYDMRGIGKTTNPPVMDKKHGGWNLLVQDQVSLFLEIRKSRPTKTQWTLAGHSLGAWLALLSSQELNETNLVLFDPPILDFNTVIKWNIIRLLGRNDLSPRAQAAKRRRTTFTSVEGLFENLKNKAFTKEWPEQVIHDFIESSYKVEGKEALLRHNPLWESYLFAQYPASASIALMSIPYKTRKRLRPLFLVGEKSDTCNPKAKRLIKFFLPYCNWSVIQDGTHMFPLIQQGALIEALKQHTKRV